MLCIALAVGTLTGCGSKKEDNRLVIWTNMNVEVDTLQKYADTWGEQNGYEVEVIHQSPSVQQFAQAVKSAEGPDAVVGIPNIMMRIFPKLQFRHAMWTAKDMQHLFLWRQPLYSIIRTW